MFYLLFSNFVVVFTIFKFCGCFSLFSNFVVVFNYPFLHSDGQIDPCQIVKWEMNKQDHIESFVIEVSIAIEGAREMSIGFLTSVNSTCGSQYDYG